MPLGVSLLAMVVLFVFVLFRDVDGQRTDLMSCEIELIREKIDKSYSIFSIVRDNINTIVKDMK